MIDPAELLAQFHRDVDRREAREESLRQLGAQLDAGTQALRARLTTLLQHRDAELAAQAHETQSAQQQLLENLQQQAAEAEREHLSRVREIESESAKAADQVQRQRGDSEWIMQSVLDDEAQDSPLREFERFRNTLQKSREEQLAEWTALHEAAAQAFTKHHWSPRTPAELENPPANRDEATTRFTAAVSTAREHLKTVKGLILPRLFQGFLPLSLFVIISAAIAVPIATFVNPSLAGLSGPRLQPAWVGISAAAGAFGGVILLASLYALMTMRLSDVLAQLQDSTAEAAWAHQQWTRLVKEQLDAEQQRCATEQKRIEGERRTALDRYELAHFRQVHEIETQRVERLEQEKARFKEIKSAQLAQRESVLRQFQSEQQSSRSAGESRWQQEIDQLQSQLDAHDQDRQARHGEQSRQLKADWDAAATAFQAGLTELQEENDSVFAAWSQLAGGEWSSAFAIPRSIRLGEYQVNLEQWPAATAQDPRLAPRQMQFELPCMLAFPNQISLQFKAPTKEARAQAIAGLQGLMLRLLTLIPPGKLRFMILDPVGLGESFGGFMHLADYDELLITSRIWTEAGQIETQLANLTAHMENVLQKYLRNEFPTIEAYNASAGEVAEPYHFLVINDFPAKFSEIAGRRLASIIQSGPRCGVYVLMITDPRKPLPHNLQRDEIDAGTTRLDWQDGAFHLQRPALSEWPIVIDAPPPPAEFTSIVKMAGESSKDARRVEVSFERVAPAVKDIWSGDSRKEIEIPLGRAGAAKLQRLRLGRGTSQHMLIAGKTGSGKSTFLHVLITNLALYYSPEEINFYLIDFKKGVEFKSYATRQLPHARVIAVESDREFGVSALRSLDEVLQQRGELFRRHGVQDIAAYRTETGKPLPRILLVVDEFQEFFVEDDKFSQTAALLLDRLVRQGRAFGIHVVLGSQTLGGAYTLARTTIGQVAVRVALQCSEADAHLILSEENPAARLLTRPGEAIYNDANGLMDGNHPFQIAWISDEQREQYLGIMQDRAFRKGVQYDPPIVFEGNIPSDVTRNASLSRVIDEFAGRDAPLPAPTVWLGDSTEIGPPTSITFPRQAGRNLLIVGQDSDAALGTMVAAVTALVASLAPRLPGSPLTILDGSHEGSPEAGVWTRMTHDWPVDVRRVRPNQAAVCVRELFDELERREAAGDGQAPPIFVFVFNLAQFRDLRKVEDDFGMGSFDSQPAKPAEPGKLFSDLLARGAAQGIHVIVWCDSFNNLERWFSRQSLREFELRIAFQMNAADSSSLIDSPAASRLGSHRALVYREETGGTEKFRPYGVPDPLWVQNVQRRLVYGPPADAAADIEEFSVL